VRDKEMKFSDVETSGSHTRWSGGRDPGGTEGEGSGEERRTL